MQLVNVTKEILLDIFISPQDKWSFIPIHALLDSGASVIFINKAWTEEKKLLLWPLRHTILLQFLYHAIPVFNVDSTKNSAGNITYCMDITISYQGHCEKVTAEIMNLGKNQTILGFMWLQNHNPEINWEHGMVKMMHCPWSYYLLQEKTAFLWCLNNKEQEAVWNTYEVHTVLDTSPTIPSKKSATELVLQSLHKFLHMFQKHESESMPTHKSWDHAIDLKDIFKAKKDRLIPVSS